MKGRIIKNISNSYICLADDGTEYSLKPRGKFKYNNESVKVGDFVEFENGSINKVLERKNTFIRPFVSNVDNVIIVTSLKRPDINYALLDEFIVNTEMENVKPVLVFTKTDLLSPSELDNEIKSIEYYKRYYDVFYADYNGITEKDAFDNLIKNKVLVVSGQTGAGKSHLLNTLSPDFNLLTQDISDALGRGKHTTRYTELLKYKSSLIADTPGFSSLDLTYIKSENLKECFPEFVEHLNECRYNQCMHVSEPGCVIKELKEKGEILSSRYESYLKFYNELKEKEKTFRRNY